jgi:hypothetical protein
MYYISYEQQVEEIQDIDSYGVLNQCDQPTQSEHPPALDPLIRNEVINSNRSL